MLFKGITKILVLGFLLCCLSLWLPVFGIHLPVYGAEDYRVMDTDTTDDLADDLASMARIHLYLDGIEVSLSDPIQNWNNRTYLPLRSYAESFGAEVTWLPETDSVRVRRGRIETVFSIGSSAYFVNGVKKNMADANLYLDNDLNRTYVPIRIGAESFGFDVTWIAGETEGSGAIYVESTPYTNGDLWNNEISIAGKLVWLGQSEEELIAEMGQPSRIDASAYGLRWYVYNRNYTRFIMVGIKDQCVGGFFSNCAEIVLKDNLGFGSPKAAFDAASFDPETTQLWYDPFDDNRLFAVFCMADFLSEAQRQINFEENQDALLRLYEMECLDITNAFRLARGENAVLYSPYAASAALAYARDMAERNFMSHFNPEGMDPMDRMNERGIFPYQVSENLAGGFSDAIHVIKGWVESESHRIGMLENNRYLGVGAYYKQASKYRFYFVQEFITMEAPDN